MSMGWNACRQMRAAVADATRVIAIEAVCAAEALELRGIEPGPADPGRSRCSQKRDPADGQRPLPRSRPRDRGVRWCTRARS